MATTYFKGDKAEYTGKSQFVSGEVFYEVKLLEGHLKGRTKLVMDAPKGAPRATEQYQLPSGEIVAIYTDTSRSAPTITFQLKGGQIVEAVKVL